MFNDFGQQEQQVNRHVAFFKKQTNERKKEMNAIFEYTAHSACECLLPHLCVFMCVCV